MKRKSLICLVMVLLLLGTLILTACGGDDDEKGTTVVFWANCNDVELRVFQEIVKNLSILYSFYVIFT